MTPPTGRSSASAGTRWPGGAAHHAAVQPTGRNRHHAGGVDRVRRQRLPKSQTDALGRVTTYTHDKYGQLTTTTKPDPDGDGPKTAPVARQKYNRLGEVLETVDPAGARVLATYDDQGAQVTATTSERVGADTVYYTTTMVPDDRGRITSVTTPLNEKTTTDYNTADERTKVTDPDAATTEFRYKRHRPRHRRDHRRGPGDRVRIRPGRPQHHRHQPHGHRRGPVGAAADRHDRLRPRRASGPADQRRGPVHQLYLRRRRPAAHDHPTAVSDDPSTSVVVKLDYDASGRRTRMTDGNNNATAYQYNSWGSPTTVVEPATPAHPDAADRTWTTVYDKAAQPTRILLPGGVSIDRPTTGSARSSPRRQRRRGQHHRPVVRLRHRREPDQGRYRRRDPTPTAGTIAAC